MYVCTLYVHVHACYCTILQQTNMDNYMSSDHIKRMDTTATMVVNGGKVSPTP